MIKSKKNPCLYCGSTESCKCTYRHMRKGGGGVEVYNTHLVTYGDMKKVVLDLITPYPDSQLCVFKFSITRPKEDEI